MEEFKMITEIYRLLYIYINRGRAYTINIIGIVTEYKISAIVYWSRRVFDQYAEKTSRTA